MGKQNNNKYFNSFQSSNEIISEKIDQEIDYFSNEDSIESSNSSISSSDFMEDASSSSSSSSSNGPLYQLSDLMDQLPIKRGLSKYYQGKSQSFARLSSAENLEDLAKRENPYNKKMKLCKSFSTFTSPKATILKKSSQKTCFSSSILRRNCSNNFLLTNCKLPTIPVHKDF